MAEHRVSWLSMRWSTATAKCHAVSKRASPAREWLRPSKLCPTSKHKILTTLIGNETKLLLVLEVFYDGETVVHAVSLALCATRASGNH
jgi:hypothetical protein